MKNEILNNLTAVLNALNGIQVSGKNNLANLSGSISVIEDVYMRLQGIDFEEKDKVDTDK